MKAEFKTFTDGNGNPVQVQIRYRKGDYIIFGGYTEGYSVTHEPTFAKAIPKFRENNNFRDYDTAKDWCNIIATVEDLVIVVDGETKLNPDKHEEVRTLWHKFVKKHGGRYTL